MNIGLRNRLGGLAVASAMLMAPGAVFAEAGPTLKAVQERGSLLCTSHNGSFKGFAEVDDKGEWKGLDIELCKALTTAIFGAPDKVQFVPLSWAQRFPAIQSGDVDVIIKVTGWTFGRDTDVGLQFSRPYFLGGFQIATHAELGATSAADLEGGTICVDAGSSAVRETNNYLSSKGVTANILTFESSEERLSAYFDQRCDGYVGWGPNLAIVRLDAPNGAESHVILPDVMSLEPQSAAMRQGDDNWVDVVNWTFSALLMAEENGITSANVDEAKANPDTPAIGKLLGATPGVGTPLGLSDDWAYNVIKHVGNFNEIYERSLGNDSPYKLDRGANSLWKDGGLLYPLSLD